VRIKLEAGVWSIKDQLSAEKQHATLTTCQCGNQQMWGSQGQKGPSLLAKTLEIYNPRAEGRGWALKRKKTKVHEYGHCDQLREGEEVDTPVRV